MQYKMGCGGVAAIYPAQQSVTTFWNCDFKYGLSRMGSGICFMGRGSLLVKGDPVMNSATLAHVPAGNMQTDGANGAANNIQYQDSQQDEPTGSYCNFERNNAYGGGTRIVYSSVGEVTDTLPVGAGPAIYAGWRPYLDGVSGSTNITITGCNFFRNLAWNRLTGAGGNGGVFATSGGPGFSWLINGRSSFYENRAQRGAVLFDDSTKMLQGNSVPGRPDLKEMFNWGGDYRVEDSYFTRNGYFDLSALTGSTHPQSP